MKPSPMTRVQVRRVDEIALDGFGMTGLVLMENAGRGAASIIDQIAPSMPIAILCGKGNNGGDGYVIARYLQLAGREVTIVSVCKPDELSGDAAVNASIASKSGIPIDKTIPAKAGVVVDCLLGTGATGTPRGIYGDLVEAANATSVMRFAIDVPTGLDCDTGEAAEPAFRADHTITFVAMKIGFESPGAAKITGKIHVVGIGVPSDVITRATFG